MTKKDTCSKCSFSAPRGILKCNQCGGWMRVPLGIRRRGWMLLILGLILAGMGAGLAILLVPTMLVAPGNGVSGGFRGTHEQAMMIIALFGFIFAFGVAGVGNGIWQIITGRR